MNCGIQPSWKHHTELCGAAFNESHIERGIGGQNIAENIEDRERYMKGQPRR
jgi:hypothetical protein